MASSIDIRSLMDCTSEANFDLLKTNPEELIKFVDRHVRVQLNKNTSFIGFVHSIDPISYSVILSVPQVDTHTTVLIPGHAILDISEIKPITDSSPPIRKLVGPKSEKEIALRKKKIMSWLKVNLLPAKEDGENIVFGNASLLCPYSVSDICTDNPMVALQMRKIIEAMPPEFEPE